MDGYLILAIAINIWNNQEAQITKTKEKDMLHAILSLPCTSLMKIEASVILPTKIGKVVNVCALLVIDTPHEPSHHKHTKAS